MHTTEREHGNPEDQYAVAVMKTGIGVVGHIPRKYQKLVGCSWLEMEQKFCAESLEIDRDLFFWKED